MVTPWDELECARCGREGTLEVPDDHDTEVYDHVPVECTACGRQHEGRRVPLGEVFSDAPDPEFDFTGGSRR